MKNTFVWATFCLLTASLLSACSPHPGSGNWQAEDKYSAFKQLQIHYDGKAELHYAVEARGELHCFWQAMDKETLDMICSIAGDELTRLRFQLRVVGDGLGELRTENELLGRFNLLPRE